MVKAETVTTYRSRLFPLWFCTHKHFSSDIFIFSCLYFPTDTFPASLSHCLFHLALQPSLSPPCLLSLFCHCRHVLLLPYLKSIMIHPISSLTHLLYPPIAPHWNCWNQTSSQPSFKSALCAWMAWICQPYPRCHWTYPSLWGLLPLDFCYSFPSWFSSYLSVTFAGLTWPPYSLPMGLLVVLCTWSLFPPCAPSLREPHPQIHRLCWWLTNPPPSSNTSLFLSGLKFWPVLLAFNHGCLASSSNLV